MKKIITLSALGLLLSLSYSSFATSPGGVCIGAGNTMTDSTGLATGGMWSSSNPAVVTINASTGLTHGVSAGTANLTYSAGGSFNVYPYHVYPAPAPITGPSSVCVGAMATLANATAGGSWSTSSYTGYADIGAATGVITGLLEGAVWVNYTMGPGCSAEVMDTVIASAPADIYGDSMICTGFAATLTDATPGGTWSSSNTAVATVSATGTVTSVSAGTAIISYAHSGVCGTGYSTHIVEVTSLTTSPGPISGTATVSAGGTTYLIDTVSGGTWSSSDTTIASVSGWGAVTGISAGTVTISYTFNGCSGPVSATIVITVLPANCISGTVNFTAAPYYGDVLVWLIKYDPITHLLTAADSALVYSYGTSADYEFCGMAADTYRVKAAPADSITSTSGYVPTYHTASFYWNTAATIAHSFGTVDAGKNIDMGTGTATTGPGFIAGDVTMGANKGTAGSVPSVSLLIYAQNSITGAIMQQTRTDAAGHYSFSNLPVGTYNIYPELINYATTPYSAISLSSSAPSMTAASFVQHTISYKITPGTNAVGGVTAAASYISTFPNPNSGKLNVNYEVAATEHAAVTLTDVTGRAVYSTTVELAKGAGTADIDLSAISNGLYMISIKSASVNYNNKVQVQK